MRFFKGEFNKKERGLNDIISFNYRGQPLIDLLKLKDLKASNVNKKNKDTNILNESGTVVITSISEDISESLKKFNLESYKKYPLTDLGSNGKTAIIDIASNIGCIGLLSIDIENQFDQNFVERYMKDESENRTVNSELSIVGLKMDMKELLQQLPNDSTNISLFAIDADVIPSKEYKYELLDQIYRVVPKDGIVISSNSIMSSFTDTELNKKIDLKWKILNPEAKNLGTAFYIKKDEI